MFFTDVCLVTTVKPETVSVYQVKKTEKDTYKKRRNWRLKDLNVIDGKDETNVRTCLLAMIHNTTYCMFHNLLFDRLWLFNELSSIFHASVLLCVHARRGLFRVPCLPHPPPLCDEKHLPAALQVCRNYFRPYLILLCAIEVRHNKENSSIIIIISVNIETCYLHVSICFVRPSAKLKFSTCAPFVGKSRISSSV